MPAIQTVNDTNGITTGVIIPIELWQTPLSFFEPLPDQLNKSCAGTNE